MRFYSNPYPHPKKMKRFYKIVCSDQCPNTIRECKTLTYKKDKQGNTIYDEFNIDPHTFSAMWYGLDDYELIDLKDKKETYKAIQSLGL